MKIKKAFSTTELIFALLVFIVSSVLLINILNNITKNTVSKIKLSSEAFYSRISTSYQGFIYSKTKNNDAKNLKNINAANKSEYLRDYFARDIKAKQVSCKDFSRLLSNNKEILNLINNEMYCFELKSKIVAGVHFDNNCNLSINLKSYFEDENFKQKDNLCGYVIYSYQDLSKDEINKHIYAIGLGRYFVK